MYMDGWAASRFFEWHSLYLVTSRQQGSFFIEFRIH